MVGPSTKPKERALVPHPDDEADVRAGLEEADRGDVLSAEESAAYVRSLVGEDASKK
jgi:predicted transcriptional regulator